MGGLKGGGAANLNLMNNTKFPSGFNIDSGVMKKIFLIIMILMITSCGDSKKESLKKVFSNYRGDMSL